MTIARTASLLVADDILYSMSGRAFIQGVYITDLGIPFEGAVVPQLAFLFLVETSVEKPFKSVTLEVTLPKSKPVRTPAPLISMPVPEGRKVFCYKWPFVLRNPVLHPGRIEAKIIHENGEMQLTGVWMVVNPTATPSDN